MTRLRLHRVVVQLGAFAARSAHLSSNSCMRQVIWVSATIWFCARKPTQLVGDDVYLLRGLRFLNLNPLLKELRLASIVPWVSDLVIDHVQELPHCMLYFAQIQRAGCSQVLVWCQAAFDEEDLQMVEWQQAHEIQRALPAHFCSCCSWASCSSGVDSLRRSCLYLYWLHFLGTCLRSLM